MLFTDVQRSVRLNKKKKSTNTSPYPDEVIDRLARAFYYSGAHPVFCFALDYSSAPFVSMTRLYQ